MYGFNPCQIGPVQAKADIGGVSEESGRVSAKEDEWLLDPKGKYGDSGGDGVVFGENGGFEVLEKRVGRLGRPPLWISAALNQCQYARLCVQAPPTRVRRPVSASGTGCCGCAHTCSAPLLDSKVPALAHTSHRLTLDVRKRQNQAVSWAFVEYIPTAKASFLGDSHFRCACDCKSAWPLYALSSFGTFWVKWFLGSTQCPSALIDGRDTTAV